MTYREKQNKKSIESKHLDEDTKVSIEWTAKDHIGSFFPSPRPLTIKCNGCGKDIKKGFQLMESVDTFAAYTYRTYCKDCFIKELGL